MFGWNKGHAGDATAGGRRRAKVGHKPTAALALTALAVVFLLPLTGQPYWIHVGTITWAYAILAASWVLLAGYAGQFSFAHMALAALGGYTSGLMTQHAGVPTAAAALVGVLAATAVGAAIGGLCLRMSGPYLALFTLAFSEIFRIAVMAEYRFTRGSLGLHMPPWFAGSSRVSYYYTGMALLAISLAILHLLLRSRAGLFWRALRENERAAASCGVHVVRYRLAAFTVASAFAGLAGTFYGHYVGILTPNLADVSQMGLLVAMAVIGGVESLPGAVVGAGFVQLLSELLREYGQWRFVLFGAALVLVQRFARNGLVAPAIAALRARERRKAVAPPGADPATLPAPALGQLPGNAAGVSGPAGPGRPACGRYLHARKERPPLLRVDGLGKRFGGVVAVGSVSLIVQEGELVGLIGPNGSGKTTLINLIAGDLPPDRGSIWLDGEPVSHLPAYLRARRGIARTFQVTQPFRRMTVLENLLVAGLNRPGASRRQVEGTAAGILAFLGLSHLAYEDARNLSGGQQKLLELGRALMLQPRLLLLDEPFAGVSRALLEEIIERLQRLNASGVTVVLVDHDMEAVQRVARRLVVMARGETIADGPAEQVRRNPAVVAAYAG